MRNINIQLLSEPERFAYAWRKKGFRKLSLLMAALTAVAAVVIVQRGPALNLSAVIEWFILLACGEVIAVGMVLYIQRRFIETPQLKR